MAGESHTALEFLSRPTADADPNVCVIGGDDAFLQHEVRKTLTDRLAADDPDELTIHSFEGQHVELRDVLDALAERTLFGSARQVVVVSDADPFVKAFRSQLEEYVEKPVAESTLILMVKSWTANTRLAKAIAKAGLTIRCQIPQKGRELTSFTKQLKDWLILLAKTQYEVQLDRAAVDLLIDLLPTEVGMLCQEVAKLSLLVDQNNTIDVKLVREHVGSWRTRKTWDMIDAAADGNAAEALQQLDRLLAAGEEPHALLPQMASTLRRFAAATRIYESTEQAGRRGSIKASLQQAGMPPFKLSSAESQLRQLGRARAKKLYGWLLESDLQIKGYNSPKDRARRVLETLIVRLSREANLESR